MRTEDASAARALVTELVGDTPYKYGPLSALRMAIEADNEESRAFVATEDDELAGIVLYGVVAGTQGAGKVHLIVVTARARLRGVAHRLADAAASDLAMRGCRFALVEMPGDPSLAPGLELLIRCGFVEESRVPAYYQDSVDLLLLRRELPPER
jgi:ribosomal protein S18 acetylase RimI-like enzyme